MKTVRRKCQRRRNKKKYPKLLAKTGAVGTLILVIFCIVLFFKEQAGKQNFIGQIPVIEEEPQIDVQLLTPNAYSRPQIALEKINGIVIHYTANPGSTAMQNKDYFEGLKDSKITKASSHFIIGLEGEIVQCIPSGEISYASNQRNYDTLSIECCHQDKTGKFNQATYDSMVELTAWLCGKFQIQVEDVIRHYDITGKNCPKYFVENKEVWEKFKSDVFTRLQDYGQ